MQKRWHTLEIIVDRSIPYCLLLLLGIIVLEIFFPNFVKPYHSFVSMLDYLVILVFGIDLIFKYLRVHSIPIFLRKYWLEIIAVFPAFLVIRLFEEFVRVANLERSVLVAQDTLEVSEHAATKASRVHYFGKFMQPLARIPRFFKAFHFYERPGHPE